MIKPIDAKERETILTEIDTNFLVEAGAGSGKTTSLIGRLLSLVKAGIPLDNIAAITFTNKAADEMKERFRIALEKEQLTSALESIDRCFIGTIHSFCSAILRERPIEAGIDPEFTELDEQADFAFREMCWEQYVSSIYGTPRASALQELASLKIDINTLKSLYHRAADFADVHLPAEETERPDPDLIRNSLFPLVEEAALFIPTTEPEKGWDPLQRRIRALLQKKTVVSEWNDERILSLASEFDVNLKVTQNRWTDKKKAKEIGERFHEWQQTVLWPFLTRWREYVYPKMIASVQPALEYYRKHRIESGLLNFQDLLMITSKLLREHADVRQAVAARYDRLLVDEFQDTDPIQAEILFLIAGDHSLAEVTNWRSMKPRPGSLFVVGDPKQSIYRFRRADISIYNEVKRKITEHGGQVIQLVTNFRSVPSIGKFVNSQFVGKFPPKPSEVQAEFVPMDTATPDVKRKKRVMSGVFTCSYPKMEGGKERIARIDANRIAKTIAWACTGGNLQIQERNERGEWGCRNAEPKDFLILTKTKDSLHLYAESLDRYGIETETSGSSARYEELSALAQLAQCLADDTDSLALLHVLRGPLFGISDRELFAYKMEGHPFSYRRIPELEACTSDSRAVRSALEQIRTYAKWVHRLPALAALYQIAEHAGLIPFSAMLEGGATRAGTIISVLEQLRDAAPFNWTSITQKLKEMCSGKGTETSSLHAGKGKAVRIMNLHKAKGLEAPVVFLACPVGETDHDAEQFIDRSKPLAEGYFTLTRRKGMWQKELIAQPAGWEEMRVKEREFMLAEYDRLLYVAATRAKQMLVVSVYPDQPKACPWTPLMEGMELTPELDESDLDRSSMEPLVGPIQVESLMEQRDRKLEAIRQATYASISVTEMTKQQEQLLPNWSSEGKGKTFGTVVHHLLDDLGKRDRTERQIGRLVRHELERLAKFYAAQEQLQEQLIPAVIQTVQNVVQSGIWQRALAAKRRLHEVPIVVNKTSDELLQLVNGMKAGKALGEGTSGGEHDAGKPEIAAASEPSSVRETVVKGVIDLLFEEEDGWVIVDFKTDHAAEDELDAFVRFYSPQIRTYANEWENTFGCKVKEAGLYFTHAGRYVTLD